MSNHFAHPRPANSDRSLDRFLREPEVLRLAGISQMTLYRWEKIDLFPKRYKIGPNSVAWKESEVLHWIASRNAVTAKSNTKGAV